jgi:hypothetical protein
MTFMAIRNGSSRIEAARKLAKSHVDFDPGVMQVFLLEGDSETNIGEPIKLLEVVEGSRPRGIEPVYFLPNPEKGNDYPLVIVDVTPAEFKKYRRRRIPHPGGSWKIGQELATRESA